MTMKTYQIDVEESHIIKKTYFIDETTKANAIARAKAYDWDDATADEPTGEIKGIKILGMSVIYEDAGIE